MRATAPARAVAPARKRRFGLWTAILIVAIVVFLAAAFALGSILLTYHEGQKSYDDVADKAFLSDSALSDASSVSLADLTVDWDALLAINPDTVGWIFIPGTNVNYPIVRAPESNPDKYLTIDFQGNSGGWWLPTYGTPYLLASNAADFSD